MFQPLPTNTPLWNTRLPSRTANRQSTSPSQNVDKCFSLSLSLRLPKCLSACLSVSSCVYQSVGSCRSFYTYLVVLHVYMCLYVDMGLTLASVCLPICHLSLSQNKTYRLSARLSVSLCVSVPISVSLFDHHARQLK